MSDYERVVWDVIAALLPLAVIARVIGRHLLRGEKPGLLLDGVLFRSFGWVMSRGIWLAATAYLLLDHLGVSLQQALDYLAGVFIFDLARLAVVLMALDALIYLLIRGWEKYCERFEISRKGEPN
ncbi:MAG: hypothetical protein FOGNACKC_05500 [Anaerolineae bacterium]|nr:hypothetical protein [Anaerolineae bacterium]